MIEPLRGAWSAHSPHRDEEGWILHFGDPRAELEALRGEMAFRDGGPERILRVGGEDRVDLLQRISAGDLLSPEVGEIRRIPFTDAKGRIVDVPWISAREDHLLLICGAGRRERLMEWIEGYTILEDVVCEPRSDSFLTERDPHDPPLLVEVDEASAQIAELVAAGLRPVGEVAHAQWCAEELRLRPGLDLDERFHPLEVGLRAHIAFDKGCFIGQEVVARLENYDKVRRRPALILGAAPMVSDAELTHDGHRGARVVHSGPRLDDEGAYALVLLEREIEEGAALRSEDGAAWTVEKTAAL